MRGADCAGLGNTGGFHVHAVMGQRFPCALVSEGFGYIKTYWAKSSLQGGPVTAAELGPLTPAEALMEGDAGSVGGLFFFFSFLNNDWVT